MLTAQNLSNTTPILNIDTLSIEKGRVTGIIGPNGAGKSTLLKMLCGILTPEKGDITFDQQLLSSLSNKIRARHIAYLEQHCFVHWPLSCEQLIELGRFPHQGHSHYNTRQDKIIIDNVIRQLNLEKFRHRSVLNLSGGERIRVLLARALATQADYLLVDEPVASLDLQYQFEIMQILQQQAKDNIGVGVIIHDMNLAAQFCDYLYLLQGGKVTAQGTPNEVFTEQRLAQVFGVKADILKTDNNGQGDIIKMLFSQLVN